MDLEADVQETVTLGFFEKPKGPHSLLRQLFPSKAGGVPAWLDPIDLPSEKSLVCSFCGDPLQFFLQVYAPIAEKESTFHRTLFVFMCPSMKCLDKRRSVKVFRCQLSHSNPFTQVNIQAMMILTNHLHLELHSVVGAVHGRETRSVAVASVHAIAQRHIRGCIGTQDIKLNVNQSASLLNNLLTLALMVAEPQDIKDGPWHDGCITLIIQFAYLIIVLGSVDREKSCDWRVANKALWPEYEIINEDDDYSNSVVSMGQLDDDQKCWASFQQRIAKAPEQVLRYCRDANAKPLWPMSSGRPSEADVPRCNYCGGPRHFEFQILPQLLFYFGVMNDESGSLDWATIVIYTFAASCESRMGYKEEFAWSQPYSSSFII